jgi:hypothetical protein
MDFNNYKTHSFFSYSRSIPLFKNIIKNLREKERKKSEELCNLISGLLQSPQHQQSTNK